MSISTRLIVAVTAGLAVTITLNAAEAPHHLASIVGVFTLPAKSYIVVVDSIIAGVLALPGIVTAAVIIALGRRRDRETRCRSWGYILRGLSEPRCSECGTRI